MSFSTLCTSSKDKALGERCGQTNEFWGLEVKEVVRNAMRENRIERAEQERKVKAGAKG